MRKVSEIYDAKKNYRKGTGILVYKIHRMILFIK